jgi:hypothetical protein
MRLNDSRLVTTFFTILKAALGRQTTRRPPGTG